MSIFKFQEKYTAGLLEDAPKLYFLNESNTIVQEKEAKKFAVRKKLEYGFREFFGVINNPSYTITSNPKIPIPDLPFLGEQNKDYNTLYELNTDVIITAFNKNIHLYIPEDFINISPESFAGVERTKDKIAQNANNRRKKIEDKYKTLNSKHIQSLTEVNCNSVAYLYQYLNDGDAWETGMEYYGYVDGLWETGSYLTVSIDTTSWNEHTAVHELGHSVSYFLRDDLFQQWISIATNTSEEPPSDYGKTEISEDFAESYAYYFMNGAERKHLERMCPIRYKYMQSLDSEGENVLLKDLRATNQLSQRFSKYDTVVYK